MIVLAFVIERRLVLVEEKSASFHAIPQLADKVLVLVHTSLHRELCHDCAFDFHAGTLLHVQPWVELSAVLVVELAQLHLIDDVLLLKLMSQVARSFVLSCHVLPQLLLAVSFDLNVQHLMKVARVAIGCGFGDCRRMAP